MKERNQDRTFPAVETGYSEGSPATLPQGYCPPVIEVGREDLPPAADDDLASSGQQPAGGVSQVTPEAFHGGAVSLSIEGMEATQGTQFYKSSRHLDPATAEPDNAVPLIARKHLAIRVYPDLQKPWWLSSVNVDGAVWFRRSGTSDPWRRAFRLNSAVVGRRATSINRGNANHTLNFRISDLYTRDSLLVYAIVWADIPGTGRRYSPWFGRTFTFIETQPIRWRIHGIHYVRDGLDIAGPTAADFLATAVYLRKTYPVPRIENVTYDTVDFSGDLTDNTGGGCGAGWNALWTLLYNLRVASGSTDPHYGLLTNGVPTGGVIGCGGGGVGASYVGDGSTMAQELGHAYDRRHAPGCRAGGPDPSYPIYNGYGTASIGEFGMDYATGQVFSPSSSNDFMSYCGNFWVSPYTYRGLIGSFASPAMPFQAAAGAEQRPVEELHLYIGFTVSCDLKVELATGVTLHGPPIGAVGRQTHYTVELWDENDRVLTSQPIYLKEAHGELHHAHAHFFESIPFRQDARKLAFRCSHDEDPTVFEIPKDPPTVEIVSASIKGVKKQLEAKVKLEWKGSCGPGEKLTYMVRYTNDGEHWRPVCVGLDATECEIDLNQLPGGDGCRLQVVASTLLRTTTAETASFVVQRKSRQAMIAGENGKLRIQSSSTLELVGTAHSPDGFCDDHDLIWFSSLQGYLGRGCHLIAHDLIPGEHVVSLVAPDGMGGETRTQTTIRILPEDTQV